MANYPVPTINVVNVATPGNRGADDEQAPDHDSHFAPSDGETLVSPSIHTGGLAPTVSVAQPSGLLALLRVPSNASAATSAATSTEPPSEGPRTPTGDGDSGSFNVELSFPSPTPSDFLSHNTTKLRDNEPNATEGKGSFTLLNPRLIADRKRSFASSDGSAADTEPDHGPRTPLDTSVILETPHPERGASLPPGDDKRDERVETRVKPDLSDDDISAPFTLSPRRLASCLDPKNLEQVNQWGGTAAVLRMLGTDGADGLRTEPRVARTPGKSLDRVPTGEKAATMSGTTLMRHADSGSQPPGVGTDKLDQSQDVSGVSLEERSRVYGVNVLPDRKTKSLLQLMWMALKDRVLVSRRSLHCFTRRIGGRALSRDRDLVRPC
jgi:Ca2+-transporting ATPase